MQSTERWLPVVGYEGLYEVSDHGRVRSLDRVVMRSNGVPQSVRGGIRKLGVFHGYSVVSLSGPTHTRPFVHRLVLLAFVGAPADGEEACHGDGNRANNMLTNLRWDTRSANVKDAIAHGTHKNAAKEYCKRGHRLSGANVREFAARKMRTCVLCRERKVPCPLCGEERSYYGMKSHLLHVHKKTVEGRAWLTEFPSTSLR